ncbi:MAG: cysteine--tRNA ligase [Planctomycetota bacterium]|jgi:cysteinyl-tRNA synthetase
MIRVYNTLSRSKESFEPVAPGKVGVYLCGPTVYKPSHIGHMVGPVIFDCIKRYLTYSGYDVTLVINVTDVDDKLIVRSKERNIPMPQLAAEMTADYMKCLDVMGIDSVDHFPKATDNMDQIIRFTSDLVEKGFAYESEGDVYFDVSKAADYGKLSGRALDSMLGEGGETAERKRSAADFALWKSAKPGEPSWQSPWGPGRPGWHIECSVMSGRLLGETFDVHGGGLDLVFPHHENEIVQSEARHGKPMAKVWMHNGLMQASSEVGKVGGRRTRPAEGDQEAQERGKIAGRHGAQSFLELLDECGFHPEQVRFFLMATHYRRPIDFSVQRILEVGTGLDTFYRFFKRYERVIGESFYDINAPARRADGEIDPRGTPLPDDVVELRTRFLEAMDDDFNTGGATGVLFDLVRRLNKLVDDEKMEDKARQTPENLAALQQGATTLRELAATLGLFRKPIEEKASDDDNLVGRLLDLLVDIRTDLRKAKNFDAADKIRDSLAELGVSLEDLPGATEWTIG